MSISTVLLSVGDNHLGLDIYVVFDTTSYSLIIEMVVRRFSILFISLLLSICGFLSEHCEQNDSLPKSESGLLLFMDTCCDKLVDQVALTQYGINIVSIPASDDKGETDFDK